MNFFLLVSNIVSCLGVGADHLFETLVVRIQSAVKILYCVIVFLAWFTIFFRVVGGRGVALSPLKTLNVRIPSAVKLLFGAIIFKCHGNYFGLCYILFVAEG